MPSWGRRSRGDGGRAAGITGAGVVVTGARNLLVALLPGVLCLGASAFVLSLLAWTHDDLAERSLEVRHGPLHWSIPLEEIRTVTPVRNLAASAALSRRRLRIRYGEAFDEIFISPARPDEFLRDLRTRAPQLAETDETVSAC